MPRIKAPVPTTLGIVADLNAVCRVYGMDFTAQVKSNASVTYVRVTSRLHRPSPNTVVGYLMSQGWKALQTNVSTHDAYRFRKPGRILVLRFPTKQDYEQRSGSVYTDDRGAKRSYNGIVNQNL